MTLTAAFADPSVTLYAGDALETLRELPDESVHTCVTSPPYWGLRSYLPNAVRLRDDLTDEERVFVAAELKRLGIRPIDGDV